MMRPSDSLPEVLVCCEPVDFRKGINGLSVLVEEALVQNPFSARLFVFTNRGQDKVKILYWERNGFCLWQKCLEKDRFHWPAATPEGTVTLSGQQLNWLLDGFDLRQWHPHRRLEYQSTV
jgi:transposase